MLRRYELTDDEWDRISDLLPPENTSKQGRPRKSNRVILNGIIWIVRSGTLGATFQNGTGQGKLFTAASGNGSRRESLTISSGF